MESIKCAELNDVLILKQWRNVLKTGKWRAFAKLPGALKQIAVKNHYTIFVVYAAGPQKRRSETARYRQYIRT